MKQALLISVFLALFSPLRFALAEDATATPELQKLDESVQQSAMRAQESIDWFKKNYPEMAPAPNRLFQQQVEEEPIKNS